MNRTSSLAVASLVGVALASGAGNLVTGAETTPVPAAASTARPSLPLSLFGVAAGEKVSIAGTSVVAEATGLPLPVGVAVELAWKDSRITVTSINAGSGPAIPTWALDQPKAQKDGSIIAVGQGFGQTVGMAREKALMDARVQAMLSSPGQVTTSTSDENDGKTSIHSSSTTTRHAGGVSSQVTDCVITVCADPASAPPLPTKPGAVARMSAQPGLQPVRCWVRISARLLAETAPVPATAAAPAP